MTYFQDIIQRRENTRLFILKILVFFIVFFVVSYIYLLNSGVVDIVVSKEHLEKMQVLRKDYKALEQIYLVETKKFDLDYAYSLGFVDASSLKFVLRRAGVAKADTGLFNN